MPSTPSCPPRAPLLLPCVSSAHPQKSRKAPGGLKSGIRVPMAFVRRDAQTLHRNLQRTAHHYRDVCARTHTRVPVRRSPGAGVPAPRSPQRGWERDAGAGLHWSPSPARPGAQRRPPGSPGWDPPSRCPLLRGAPAAAEHPPLPGSRCREPVPSRERLHPRPEGPRSSRVAAAAPPSWVPAAPASQPGSRRRSDPGAFGRAGSQTRRSRRVFLLPHKMQEFRGLTRQRDNMKCRLRAPVALGNERLAVASQKAHS